MHRQAVELGMRELQAITNRLAHRFRGHPAFASPFGKFTGLVIAAVQNQDDRASSIPAAYRAPWEVIRRWICSDHQQPSDTLTPELSGTKAWRCVQQVFSAHDNHGESTADLHEQIEREFPTDRMTETLLRWLLTREKRRRGKYQHGQPHLPPQKEIIRHGMKFDEFDISQDRLERDAVTIESGRFRPQRRPHEAYRLAGYQPIFSRTEWGRGAVVSDRQQLDYDGDEIAMEFAAEAVAEMRATGQCHGRQYWNQVTPGANVVASLLVDLSVSMEQERGDLPAVPLQMAIAAAHLIREDAARADVELEIWGIVDGGRQPVSLLRIDQRDIDRMHAMGIGGARFGSGIRFLCRRRSRPGNRHLIICLTDGAGVYINEGHDELVGRIRRTRCAACQLRTPGHKGCSVEKNERVETGEATFIFRNAEYQYADIGHAIDTAPAGTSVRYVEFAQDPYDSILHRFLGNNWATCTGNLSIVGRSYPTGSHAGSGPASADRIASGL